MPRYLFDIVDGQHLPDRHGLELRDVAAAQNHAIEIASTFIGQRPSEVWRDNAWTIAIRHEDGDQLCRLEIKVIMSDFSG